MDQYLQQYEPKRPRTLNTATVECGKQNLRKLRQRQSQRRYRAKREITAKATVEKAAVLENTLRGIIGCYTELQAKLVRSYDQILPCVGLQLTLTALDISYFSRRSMPDTPEISPTGREQHDLHASLMLAKRLIHVATEPAPDIHDTNSTMALPTPSSLYSSQAAADQAMMNDLDAIWETSEAAPAWSAPCFGETAFHDLFADLVPQSILQASCSARYQSAGGHLLSCRVRKIPIDGSPKSSDSEGDWLDLIDVHAYLANRGIVLRQRGPNVDLIRLHFGDACCHSASEFTENTPNSDAGLNYAPSTMSKETPEAAWQFAELFPTGRQEGSPKSACVESPSTTKVTELANRLVGSITIKASMLVGCLASKIVYSARGVGVRREAVDEAIQKSVVSTSRS
ncbi:hypothetical protein NLG97_g5210 [Lecanicillium saksenae]|uniref:Uncharacterized protein n=1 Tax=Lecanicillium saksenae TaxID=468837 RepID=A0ACC1QUS2_9HYPO|nr:hypothetical protein NLG97_g5210 [Lecanicillium saksenae]